MTKRRLALLPIILVLPFAILPASCSSDDKDGDDKGEALGTGGTGTQLGTGTAGEGTTTGTGTSNGGVLEIDQTVWDETLDLACNGSTNETEGGGGKLELVVDISGSMSWEAPGTNMTKWEATREAIRTSIVGDANNAGLSPAVAAGMLFYPGLRVTDVSTTEQDSSVCLNLDGSVDMALLTDEGKAAFSAALDDAATGQGTPTHDAYKWALDKVVLGDAAKAFMGSDTMLLITDGMPTLQYGCYNTSGDLDYNSVPLEPILAEVKRAADLGIKTFAIGSPGSDEGRGNDGYDWLSEAAEIGGTSKGGNCSHNGPNYCHMDLTQSSDFAADLAAALDTVTSTVMSCEYNVLATSADSDEAVDPSLTVVMASFSSGEKLLIGRDDSPDDCTVGWYLNSDTNQVVLCPETCDRVQSDADVTLNVLFVCNKDDVPVIPQ